MNLVLIGYRCSGKSTVAGCLADALGWRAVHIDREIGVRAGERIIEIIAKHGWERFREIEGEVISAATAMDRVVIDTGGSAVLNDRNVKMLRAGGWLVWLRTSALEVRTRMQQLDEKLVPLSDAANAVDEVEEMIQRMNPLYEAAADCEVDTDGRSTTDIAREILKYA
jgi:shikimate kinase